MSPKSPPRSKVSLTDAIGALNGVLGDYLERTGNGLALELTIVGEPPRARRLAVFVHGLMATEGCWSMFGRSYPDELARDLGLEPVLIRYNSGRHVSQNGRALHEALERLATERGEDLEELVLVGHSMGGLVLRSATHFAAEAEARGEASRWLAKTSRAVYLGSPHLGAPLERVGNALTWILRRAGATLSDPVTEVLGEVLALRSSGIKDLRYGNLRDEDWLDVDPDALLMNARHPVPLLPSIRHHMLAGELPARPVLAALFGDGLVTARSALGDARPSDRSPVFPREHVRILERTGHLQLLSDDAVYDQLRAWLST